MPRTLQQSAWRDIQMYKTKKKMLPLLDPAPAVCSNLLLICLPSYRFWRSTLIDLRALQKTLLASKPPTPRYAYFRACIKKLWTPLYRFYGPLLPPQRFGIFLFFSVCGGGGWVASAYTLAPTLRVTMIF